MCASCLSLSSSWPIAAVEKLSHQVDQFQGVRLAPHNEMVRWHNHYNAICAGILPGLGNVLSQAHPFVRWQSIHGSVGQSPVVVSHDLDATGTEGTTAGRWRYTKLLGSDPSEPSSIGIHGDCPPDVLLSAVRSGYGTNGSPSIECEATNSSVLVLSGSNGDGK